MARGDNVIFGGTFDPIHEGHLTVIKSLTQTHARVIIAPTSQNPWKDGAATPIAMRFQMIRLVLEAEKLPYSERIKDTGVILYDSPYTYSVELVEELQRLGLSDLAWAVGEDSVASVSKWRDWSTRGCRVITAPIVIDTHSSAVRAGTEQLHPALREYAELNRLYR